jgi:hypothetical protein
MFQAGLLVGSSPRLVNFYCSHNALSASTRKNTMTAIIVTLAIVFMASPSCA